MRSTAWILEVSEDLVIISFLLAVFVALAQFSAPPLSGWAFNLAYVAFPFLIFSIFLAVYAHSWALIRAAWNMRSWKWFSLLAGVGYALFYIFVTNTVTVPDVGVPIPAELSNGYIVPFEVYGPMTVWPDVEFYFPNPGLTGYFSVGNVLLIVSLGLLTAFAVSLLIWNIATRTSVRVGTGTTLGGAFLTALFTNACCCCTPVLLPLLAIFFGGAVPTAMAQSLLNPEAPVSNLLVLANLASLLTSVILSTKRCRSIGNEESRDD